MQKVITHLPTHCLLITPFWSCSLCRCRRALSNLPISISIQCSLKPVYIFLFLLFQPFVKAPYVFVTAVHPATNKHDAASVWAEDVTRYNFRACLRELKNFDGAHQYLSVVSTKLGLSYAKHLKIVLRKSLAGQILLRISRLKMIDNLKNKSGSSKCACLHLASSHWTFRTHVYLFKTYCNLTE